MGTSDVTNPSLDPPLSLVPLLLPSLPPINGESILPAAQEGESSLTVLLSHHTLSPPINPCYRTIDPIPLGFGILLPLILPLAILLLIHSHWPLLICLGYDNKVPRLAGLNNRNLFPHSSGD